MVHDRRRLRGECIDPRDAIDLITEKLDAVRLLALRRREHIHDIAHHAEGTTLEVDVIPVILDIDQLTDEVIPVLPGTVPDGDRHVRIFLRLTETVDAGNRGYDDDIITLVQGRHRRATQLIDLVIDIRILLDVGIGRWQIRLRLIIIIVGNEVLDRVLREELLHLGIQLCRQGLVM